MNKKLIGIFALISFVFVTLWIVLFIISAATYGPTKTFEQALGYVSRLDALFYLTYLNATIFTLLAVMVMAGLYLICKPTHPTWSMMGAAFIPVYGVMNIFAYFSQLVLMPVLIPLRESPGLQAAVDVWLNVTMQILPGSAVNTFNNMAYAILGIPSIIFGMILYQKVKTLRIPGALLALNGVACILGVIGILMDHAILGWGSVIGGVLWWAALLPLGMVLFKDNANPS
jgi:hypothetical protein